MGLFSKNKDDKQKELDLQKRAEALDYQANLLKTKENNLEIARSKIEDAKIRCKREGYRGKRNRTK